MAEKTFHSLTLPGQETARVPLTAVEFNTSTAYKVKDYCTYQGKLYRCTVAHAAGAWNASHFVETDMDAELDRKLDIPPSQASAPANPRVGDLWIDNDENSPIYNVDAAPTLGSTNAVQSGGTKTALNAIDSRKVEHGCITGDFSASVDYRVGDLVFYTTTANGITTRTLYRCTTAHNAAAWNAAHFTATTLEVELQRARDNEKDTDIIGDLFGAKTTYAVGDYCIYNDNLYRCIQAVDNTGVTTPAFDPDDWTQVALANDISDLKSALNVSSNVGLYKHPDYHNDPDPTQGTSSNILGVTRYGSIVALNGDTNNLSAGAGTHIRVRLNGNVARTVSATTVREWAEDLIETSIGHLYRIQLKMLSGSIDDTNRPSSDAYPVGISLYKPGSSKSVGASIVTNGMFDQRLWISDGEPVNLVLYICYGVVFSNATFEIVFEDINAINNTDNPPLSFAAGSIVRGRETNVSGRYRTVDYIAVGKGTEFFSTDYELIVDYYDENLKFIEATPWTGYYIKVDRDCFVRVLIKSTDDIDTTVSLFRMAYNSPTDDRFYQSRLDGYALLDTDNFLFNNPVSYILFEYGFLSVGGENSPNAYTIRTRGFIKTNANQLLFDSSAYSSIVGRIVFYNSNFEVISDSATPISANPIDVPDGAKYYRFSITSAWTTTVDIGFQTDLIIKEIYQDTFEQIYGDKISYVVKNYNSQASTERVGYVWISDIHLKTTQPVATYEVFPRVARAVKEVAERSNLDFVCIGGDVLDGEQSSDSFYGLLSDGSMALAGCKIPIIWLFGNHDANDYGTPALTKNNAIALFPGNSEFYNSIVFPEREQGYFYFDIQKKNTRIICLNSSDAPNALNPSKTPRNWWTYSQEQIQWLCKEALNTDNNIIILTHVVTDKAFTSYDLGDEGGYTTDLNNVITAYNARQAITLYGEMFDFTQSSGKILYVHSGHTHIEFDPSIQTVSAGSVPCVVTGCAKQYNQDLNDYETVVDRENGIYTIATQADATEANANSYGYQYYHWTDREAGTLNESLFDVVSATPEQVKCFRVGAGKDRIYALT